MQAQAKDGTGAVGGAALDLAHMGGQMLATAAAASTGGGSRRLFVGLSSYAQSGQAADAAKQRGADVQAQHDYGTAMGLANAAIERLGGIGGAPAVRKLAGEVAGRVLPRGMQQMAARAGQTAIGKIAGNALEEGLENAVQYDISRRIGNRTLGNDEKFSAGQMLGEAGAGALMGGIFGGVHALGGHANGRSAIAKADVAANPVDPRTGLLAQLKPKTTFADGGKAVGAAPYLSTAEMADYMHTGKKMSTRDEKGRMLEAGDSPTIQSQQEFNHFVEESVAGKPATIKAFGVTGERLADALYTASDGKIDIRGKYLEIGSEDIAHSYNGHSQPKQAGDIPLSLEDYQNIPQWISSFDDILQVRKGKNAVIFQVGKKINGHSIITEIVSNERNSIRFRDMWGVSTDKYLKVYKNNKNIGTRVAEVKNTIAQMNPSADIPVNHSVAQAAQNSKPQNHEILPDGLDKLRNDPPGVDSTNADELVNRVRQEGAAKEIVSLAQDVGQLAADTGMTPAQALDYLRNKLHAKFDSEVQVIEQELRSYRPQGVTIVKPQDGTTGYRASNNDQWYREFYSKNGRAPRKNELRGIAEQLLSDDLRRGRGQFISPDVKPAYQMMRDLDQMADVMADTQRAAPFGQNTVGAAQANPESYDHMQNAFGTIAPGEAPRARELDVPTSTNGDDRVSLYARTLMEASATPDELLADYERNVANGLFSHNPRKDASSLSRAVHSITDKGYAGALAQWDDVVQGRRTAAKDDIVLAQMLYAEAAKAGDMQTAMKLAAEIAAEGTRAGQNVQALRMLKKLTPEGQLYYAQRSIANLEEDLQQ